MDNSLRLGLFAGMVGLTALVGPFPQDSKQHDDARGWFLKVQQQAYDMVMPMDVPDLVVVYRGSHESVPATFERYLAIQRIRVLGLTSPNALEATVIMPVARSVQQQSVALREANPSGSLDSLLPKLVLKRQTLDGGICKAIGDQVRRLSDIQLSIPRPDRIILDAPVHRFAIHLGSLKMSAEIEGDTSSVVAWAARTHELLLGCLAK
jgi:hypothetical protein